MVAAPLEVAKNDSKIHSDIGTFEMIGEEVEEKVRDYVRALVFFFHTLAHSHYNKGLRAANTRTRR